MTATARSATIHWMADADELARRALSTPAVDAPDALEVLVDVLLEAGILTGEDAREVSNDIPLEWRGATFELRRRAHSWAKRRLVPSPNPTAQLVEIVSRAIDREELPHAVIGVVGPFIVRVHFLHGIDPHLATVAREAVVRDLPASIVVEVTGRAQRTHAT